MTFLPQAAASGHSSARLPAALALLAGITDVTSWILLGGLFTAHITGNLVVLAANIVTGTPPSFAAVLAVPVFAISIVLATVLAHRFGAHTNRSRNALLGAQDVLLIAAAALSFATAASANPDAPLSVVIGMCAVAAMAFQNAYLHLVTSTSPSTGVMTGNLVTGAIAATELALSKGRSTVALAHWRSSWPLLTGFICGCLIGSVAAIIFRDHAAVVPAAVAVLIHIVVARSAASLDAAQEPEVQPRKF